MLAASSYARPYRPSTLQSAPSLLSLAYPRSRSQPPAKRRPLPQLQGLQESPPVMTQSCLGALQQGCESEKQENEDMASQVKEEKEKPREKALIGDEEKENKIGGIFRRRGGSKASKSSILIRSLPKVRCQLFDRSLSNSSTYQHLKASPIRLPAQFPFLQTLV